jgi:uncharacterized membrane protein YraQ (UPF0718 family)
MIRTLKNWYVELISILIFGFFLFLITSGVPLLAVLSYGVTKVMKNASPELHNFSTVFLSLFIEGLPLILVGVLVSSLVHVYVKEEMVWRLIPRNPLLSIPLVTCFGLVLPICECGIVPVARRLVQKGLPSYVAFTFLLAAPIVNPVTIISTYLAFGQTWRVVFLRVGLGALIAAVMGFLFFLIFRGKPVLKVDQKGQEVDCCDHHHDHGHAHQHDHECTSHHGESGLMHALRHSVFEFIDMGKYFVLGALIAAGFQTIVGTAVIKSVAQHEHLAILLMMALAFGLSVCSSADAFLAASFRSVMGTAPLLSFLVFGPMVDVKNLLMMLGGFRKSVVLFFIVGPTVLTMLSCYLFL